MKPRGLIPRMLAWCDRHPRKAAFLLSLALHANSVQNGIVWDDRASVRSRRPAVLRRLHAIDATRVHLTMPGVVSFLILRPFGPFPVNTMLHAGNAGTRGRRGRFFTK